MPQPNQITPAQLMRLIGLPECPRILDVRLTEDVARDPRIIPGSRLIPHDQCDPAPTTTRTVVVCARGRKLSEGVAALLRAQNIPAEVLEGGAQAWAEASLPMVPLANLPKGNLWVTRHRPKIDRIACPWAIRRFIDPSARFLYVAPTEVLAVAERFNAIPFDIEGVLYSHRGDQCSFDTMLDLWGLQTEALQRLALVIRAADTDRHDLSPQAAGLLAISVGLSRQFRDDLEQLAVGMTLYDALYRWARDGHDESHDWPAGRIMTPTPSLRDLTRAFARIGILSFGGPAAQIAMMHRDLVDDRKWVSEQDYLSALSFCMLLPGPEAMQLATWIGWRMHGTLGGLIAGLLFVLPGAVIVLALSMIYAAFGQVPLVAALFTGIQAAVVAVVVEALLRVAKRALKSQVHWVIAALAFVALFFFGLPFPLIILAAAAYGYLTTTTTAAPLTTAQPWGQTLRAVAIWGAVWLLPLALIVLWHPGLYADIAIYFSKLAVVTFGGAYAVLAWMSQSVVADKQWLTVPQMMHGLGLAETTPGPLILVVEFVAYIAAWQRDGWVGGVFGAAIALWMTFAPCFLWIFAGAPWIARLTAAPRLSGALRAITAAVVGVIANLSLWFAAHVFFRTVTRIDSTPFHLILPDVTTLNWASGAIALAAAYLLLRLHQSLILVLALAAMASAAMTLL